MSLSKGSIASVAMDFDQNLYFLRSINDLKPENDQEKNWSFEESTFNEKKCTYDDDDDDMMFEPSPKKKIKTDQTSLSNEDNKQKSMEILKLIWNLEQNSKNLSWFGKHCKDSFENFQNTIFKAYLNENFSYKYESSNDESIGTELYFKGKDNKKKKKSNPRLNNLLQSFLRILLEFLEEMLVHSKIKNDISLISQGKRILKQNYPDPKVRELMYYWILIQKEYKKGIQGKNQNQFMKIKVKEKIKILMFCNDKNVIDFAEDLHRILKEDICNNQVKFIDYFDCLFADLMRNKDIKEPLCIESENESESESIQKPSWYLESYPYHLDIEFRNHETSMQSLLDFKIFTYAKDQDDLFGKDVKYSDFFNEPLKTQKTLGNFFRSPQVLNYLEKKFLGKNSHTQTDWKKILNYLNDIKPKK